MPPFGFDPVGSMLGWLVILLVVAAALLGLTSGSLTLLLAWRAAAHRRA